MRFSDSYLDIDLENVVENVKRSYYFVLLYVGDIKNRRNPSLSRRRSNGNGKQTIKCESCCD